jgi:transcriptional/translational regulatory protein YebC/TACO1
LVEECEGKVANLLASMDNLPSGDVNGKIEVLVEIVELQQKQHSLQQKQIEDLQAQLDEHEEDYVHVEKPFWEVEREAQPKKIDVVEEMDRMERRESLEEGKRDAKP